MAKVTGDLIQLRGFKTGGSTGQVPMKNSGSDFDWSWGTINTFSGSWNDLQDKPLEFPPAAHTHDGVYQPVGSYIVEGDARLTDSREWTATTVDQAEAEAGVATTRRAWTAQRVRQAIAAWWATVSASKADAVHTHPTSQVTGLDAALAGKAASSHTHATSDVSGLQSALDAKQPTLVSGTNIKTVSGVSILGTGDLNPVTATNVAAVINSAAEKTTPANDDRLAITDSAASHALKKLTWANLKATLKTYLDGLYSALGHTHPWSEINKTGAVPSDVGAGTIATQDANNVAITGGTISGLTSLGSSGYADVSGYLSAAGGTLYADHVTSRVGVGTTSPTAKLDVNGTFNAVGNATIGGTLTVTGQTELSSSQAATNPTSVMTRGLAEEAQWEAPSKIRFFPWLSSSFYTENSGSAWLANVASSAPYVTGLRVTSDSALNDYGMLILVTTNLINGTSGGGHTWNVNQELYFDLVVNPAYKAIAGAEVQIGLFRESTALLELSTRQGMVMSIISNGTSHVASIKARRTTGGAVVQSSAVVVNPTGNTRTQCWLKLLSTGACELRLAEGAGSRRPSTPTATLPTGAFEAGGDGIILMSGMSLSPTPSQNRMIVSISNLGFRLY